MKEGVTPRSPGNCALAVTLILGPVTSESWHSSFLLKVTWFIVLFCMASSEISRLLQAVEFPETSVCILFAAFLGPPQMLKYSQTSITDSHLVCSQLKHTCLLCFFKSKIPIQVDALTPGFNHTISKLKVLFTTAVIKVQQSIHQVPYLFLYHCNFWQVCFPTLSKICKMSHLT